MVTTSIEHSVLDGSTVRIAGPDLDLSKPVSSIVTTVVGRLRVEFTVFPRGFGAAVAWDVARVRLQESYAYRGGSLRVGSALDDGGRVDFLIGVWEGPGLVGLCAFLWGRRGEPHGCARSAQP